MNVIISINILLAIVISACAAAGLTDEQLAQIFDETPDRGIGLSETRGDYAPLQDISDIDQTWATLLANTDDTSGVENIFDGDMMTHLNVDQHRTLDDIILSTDDDGSSYDDALDIALLQQNLVTSGEISAATNTDTDFQSNMQSCLYSYNENHELCAALLNEKSTEYRDDGSQSYCTTRSCMKKLESLFKRNIKRSAQTECHTVGCKITQYVNKKSFCNRYQCGGRRKKDQKMSGEHEIVYPALTNVNVFGSLPMSQLASPRSYSALNSRSADTRASGRNIAKQCGSQDQCTKSYTLRKKVKGPRRKGKKQIEQ